MIANYHTHTRWCRHATGEIEEYIREGIAKGLVELAITDHVPHDNTDPRRMHWDELEEFDHQLNACIEKYKNQIHIIKGFECEYLPEKMDDYRRLREEYGYRLLILGQHISQDRTIDYFNIHFPNQIEQYTTDVIAGLETGLFNYLAHPDVVLCSYGPVDDRALACMGRIFETAQRLNLPVEINANGMRDGRAYPDEKVWEFSRQYDLRYLISSDAHMVEHLVDEEGIARCEEMASRLGIQIIERLEL